MNKPEFVVVYGYDGCVYCDMAKKELRDRGIYTEFYDIKADPVAKSEWKALNVKTVPQIFFDGRLVGGYTEMMERLK